MRCVLRAFCESVSATPAVQVPGTRCSRFRVSISASHGGSPRSVRLVVLPFYLCGRAFAVHDRVPFGGVDATAANGQCVPRLIGRLERGPRFKRR